MIRIMAVAALLTSTVTSAGWAQCSAADKVALEALDKAWGEAGTRGDRAALEALYADGYMGLSAVGTTNKPTTVANAMRDAALNRANPQPTVTPDHYVISCTPTTATITHRNTIPADAGSAAAPTYSRSIHFLEKRGNRWQVVSSTGHGLSDEMQLAYMEQDWNDASLKRDAGWVEKNYAPFASDIASRTGAMESKAQAVESMRNGKMLFESLELSELAVRVDGNAAVVTGVNHTTGKDEQGKPFDRRVRFTDTFIKRDGAWKVWATQGTLVQ